MEIQIGVTKEEAMMLQEIISKSAAPAAQAKVLASLYEKINDVVKEYGS